LISLTQAFIKINCPPKEILMNVKINTKDGIVFCEMIAGDSIIRSDGDVTDLLAICFDANTNRFLIHADNLTNDFFDLKTKNAGLILQKFVNYNCRLALLIPGEKLQHPRMKEFVLEANQGDSFHFFEERESALAWLIRC
jgi:PadR family transcriptional regulator, regulatory protein AphA